MKVTVLIENSTPSDRVCAKHGLSLFLETGEQRILFDMGPDASFLDNAKTLGVDVATADLAVLSHGHFDHAGGLRAYLDATESTSVYASTLAFAKHVADTPFGYKDIGAAPELAADPRIELVGACHEIDENLTLVSRVEPKRLFAKSNAILLEEASGEYVPDSFAHEQSLIVREGERYILVSGCSHTGIVNIIERAEEVAGHAMDVVVAGMHLMDPSTGLVEDPEITRQIAEILAAHKGTYYTYHCTGLAAYSVLRDVLGERINYLYAGSVVEV